MVWGRLSRTNAGDRALLRPPSASMLAGQFDQEGWFMRKNAVVLAVLLPLTPFGAGAADLVVWWDKALYAQEERRYMRLSPPSSRRPASRSSSCLPRVMSSLASSWRPLRPVSRPTSPSGICWQNYVANGPSRPAGGSPEAIGSFSNLFDPDALVWVIPGATRRTDKDSIWASRRSHDRTTSTSGRAFWSARASRWGRFRGRGRRFGPSGATRFSRRCAGHRVATTSGASA